MLNSSLSRALLAVMRDNGNLIVAYAIYNTVSIYTAPQPLTNILIARRDHTRQGDSSLAFRSEP